MLNFQKKYAVAKAAEVIKLFERMAETDPLMDLKKLRKSVLNNLVDRHRAKEPDSEYWSMQLLIKLGLIPDPDNVESTEVKLEMTVEEREARLKDVGLFLPEKNLEALNKNMIELAKANHKSMVEDNLKKLSKEEVRTLKKLGMTNEQIAELGPNENPFKNFGMAEKQDVVDLLERQKEFYEQLQKEFVAHCDQHGGDDFLRRSGASKSAIAMLKAGEDEEAAEVLSPQRIVGERPHDFAQWSKKRQLELERKKLYMLQEYYQQERARQKEGRDRSWLQDYKEGELEIFEDYLHKMVMSKNHEIYKQAQIKKNDPRASSESSFEESASEGAASTDSDDLRARVEKKKGPKVRASGVVYEVHIDPDAESEDDGADPRFATKRRSGAALDQEEE